MIPFDQTGAFRPTTSPDQLRRVAVRGIGAMFLYGGLGLALQFTSGAVLARLLAPGDFGLVTMVTTFSLLLANFGLNGFTEAVVQAEEIDRTLASNLFWLNVGGSATLSLAFAAAGSLIARLYGDPRITAVTEVVSLMIFLTGVSVLHLALLRRAMRFKTVSANDFVGKAIAIAVAIVMSLKGYGYWALVAAVIVAPASTSVGALILCPWIPSLPRRGAGTSAKVRFAANTYLRFSTGYFSNNLDNFLVGWRLGSTSLGFYKKAFDLFALPSVQLGFSLTNLAVSALSRFQRDLPQYKRYFLGALGVMAFIGMGLSGELTLAGRDLIFVLLGPKWNETGRIFTIFGPGIGMMLLYSSHIWINLSIGRADRWLRWGFVDMFVTAVSIIIGLHWAAEGVALAWVVAYWLITLPSLWYAGRPIQLSVRSMVGVVWRYILAATMAGCGTFFIASASKSLMAMSTPVGAILRLTVTTLLFATLYLGAVVVLHGGYEPLYQIAKLLKEMISRRTPPVSVPVTEETAVLL